MCLMEKEIFSNQSGFDKLSKAIDYLHKAANLFDQAERYFEASKITDIISKFAQADWEDKLEGGKADNKTPKDFDQKQLAKGIAVEIEHTKDKHIATEIAMDHLVEDPNYYKKLEIMEAGEAE